MKIIKIFLSLAIIAVIGYGTYHGLFLTHFTKISNITIVGANPQLEEDISKLHGIVKGESFWDIDVEQVVAHVKQHDWVENVVVKKIFPNEIVIQVTERNPYAVLNKGHGHFEFVDENNFVFGPAPSIAASQKVVLSGKSLVDKAQLREPILEAIKQLPQTGAMSLDDISEVQYNNDKGYQVYLAKTGIVVDLGKENIPIRIDRARKVVQYLEAHQINASHVDADYAKKVLVKVRQHR